MVQKSSVRGRPRSFDPDQVLANVRDTFWRHGYAGTSVDQLVTATGLHKPSLYGAFGDKRRLYLAALNAYLEEARTAFGEVLARPKLADSLGGFFRRVIAMYTRDGPAGRGCFMMSTAVPEAGEDPEIVAIVRGAMEGLDRAMVRRFQRAIDDGELPPSADPEELARVVVTSHYELSSRARAGYSAEELKPLAEQTLATVRRLGGLGD